MTRQCNECENPADVILTTLPNAGNNKNLHFLVPYCAEHAHKAHRKPCKNPRWAFYLRESMEQEQVLRELLKT